MGLIAAVVGSHALSAQNENSDKSKKAPAVYNPYPPGIVPPDLDSEIERVRREVRGIFKEALTEWRARHRRL
jgi:cytochrome c peroxidase